MEKRDYEIVNKRISEYFIAIYEGKAIARTVNGVGADRQVEVNLLRIKASLLYPGIVSNLGGGYTTKPQGDEYLQLARSM